LAAATSSPSTELFSESFFELEFEFVFEFDFDVAFSEVEVEGWMTSARLGQSLVFTFSEPCKEAKKIYRF
jgi:hypothetical protein